MAQNLGFTVWLTGMLGAGKSTVANYVAARLRQVGRNVEILDEDELGEALWAEMDGSTKEQRIVISRRMAFLAELLTRNGACVMVACTSPYKSQREHVDRAGAEHLERDEGSVRRPGVPGLGDIHHATTLKRRQRSGTPFSSCSRRRRR